MVITEGNRNGNLEEIRDISICYRKNTIAKNGFAIILKSHDLSLSQKKMKLWFGESSVTEDILTVNSVWRVSYCRLKVAMSGNRKLRVQRKMDSEFTII